MKRGEPDYDVIVVGSGPAGVSAAFPLLEAGLRVLLVDGGREASLLPPDLPYLHARQESAQWQWMLGKDFYALKNSRAASPKLRVPGHAYVFDGFVEANQIDAEDYIALGSLARGGLSNAWGCGVARLSSEELQEFPFVAGEIEASYARVARRMGVSGAADDDLTDYFGLDAWAEPPLPIEPLREHILSRYASKKPAVAAHGVRMGRSRVAVLGHDRGGRLGCDLSGNCLWGCHRRALYSASDDLGQLKKFSNFSYRSGFIVDRVDSSHVVPEIEGKQDGLPQRISARKVLLAAGTLATTRLALQAINYRQPVTMHACPTAAFLLWVPSKLGSAPTPAFGLGQVSFVVSLASAVRGFGSLFSTTGLPVAEFVRHLPINKRCGIDLLRHLLSSCVVGNLFLPGYLSNVALQLTARDRLKVVGGYGDAVPELMREAERRLRRAFWKSGALLLPMSFTIGPPGGDIHYASSLPMRVSPAEGETDAGGALCGARNIHVVDGACLSRLTEKSHTLTIMANADRIAHRIVQELGVTS